MKKLYILLVIVPVNRVTTFAQDWVSISAG